MSWTPFGAVSHSTTGIGGYISSDTNDHAFAFDGSSSGRRDHIVFYNSGKGKVYVLRKEKSGGDFSAIYKAETGGIGGWDFSFFYDRALAFDYDSSGKMDHVVCYRPGSGGIYILKHAGQGTFAPVFAQNPTEEPSADGGMGIGGFDLRYPWDTMLAFDLDRKKCSDALFIYTGMLGRSAVIKRVDGEFVPLYREYSKGVSDYPLQNEGERAVVIDWTREGFDDHILLYNTFYGYKKPVCAVVHKQGNSLVTVWTSLTSISGWPGHWGVDVGFTFDAEGKGSNCTFGIYHQGGEGEVWMMTSLKSDGNWSPVYQGFGIGGSDLKSANDNIFAVDYEGKGTMDYLCIWRATTGDVLFVRRK